METKSNIFQQFKRWMVPIKTTGWGWAWRGALWLNLLMLMWFVAFKITPGSPIEIFVFVNLLLVSCAVIAFWLIKLVTHND